MGLMRERINGQKRPAMAPEWMVFPKGPVAVKRGELWVAGVFVLGFLCGAAVTWMIAAEVWR